MRHLPRVYVPALALMLCCMVGCGATVCSQLADARSTLNLSIDAVHTAHAIGAIPAKDEKLLIPYFTAVDAAIGEGESQCIAEQLALKNGDKPAAQTALQKANQYLKAALAGLRAYATAEPAEVKTIRASRATTRPA